MLMIDTSCRVQKFMAHASCSVHLEFSIEQASKLQRPKIHGTCQLQRPKIHEHSKG
jgi:hypothetical protein